MENSINFCTTGEWGQIKQATVESQGADWLTLAWNEPLCSTRASLAHYSVTIHPDWNSGPKDGTSTLIIKPECLDGDGSSRVSVTLKENTCGPLVGYKFTSCAPYNISVLPVYELSSANSELLVWETSTLTLPLENEASITSLDVTSVGKRFISISWPIPSCRIPVSEWKLQDLVLGNVVSLPPDCPMFINSSHLTLNIENTITCQNSNLPPVKGLTVIPCSNYTLKMNVKYSNLEEQAGSNNVASARTENERESFTQI